MPSVPNASPQPEDPTGSRELTARAGGGPVWKRWLGLWIVLALAGLVRVAYHLEHQQGLEYGVPTVDARYHDQWARHMVGLPLDLQPEEGDAAIFDGPSLRPIGYPWFLAGVYALTGGSLTAALILQHLLGILAVAILWFTLAPRAGALVAGIVSGLWAVHFAPVYFEGELHATALLIVLQLGGLWAFLRLLEGKGWAWAATAGGLFGLAALVRPNVLLPAFALLVAAGCWPRWWQHSQDRWRRLGVMGVAVVLGVLPGAIRNAWVSGEWIPMTATAGLNLYLGQGPQATGLIDSDLGELGRFRTCFDYPDVKAHVETKLQREMSAGELDAWFRSQAWQHMGESPGRAVGLLFTKAALLVHPIEVGHNKEVELEVRHSNVLRFLPLPFTGVMAVLLWGLFSWVVRWRTREQGSVWTASEARVAGVHLVWALGFALSLLPFFAASRYRVPWLPHGILWGVLAAWPLLRRREGPRWSAGLGVFAAVLAWTLLHFAVPAWTPYDGPYPHRWHADRGMTAAQLGRLELARQEFEAALQSDPGSRTAHLELANLALREERWRDAQAGYEAVLTADPSHPTALFNLGYLAQREQRFARALEYYRRASLAAPTLLPPREAHTQLVWQLVAHPQAGEREAALAMKAMQAWMQDRPGVATEWELLAACQAKTGEFAAARTSVQRALELARQREPNSPLVRRIEEAQARYDRGEPPRLPGR